MSWVILGESVVGTSHRGRESPCQDAFRFRHFGQLAEWMVIVVADGAGSAAHSDVGAIRACDEFVRLLETHNPESYSTRDGMVAMFTEVREVLIAESERLGVSARDLACTVLLAVVGPTFALLAQIGDGAIVFGDETGYRIAFWPDVEEYANATDFLTDDQFADSLRFDKFSASISEVAVFTDGLQRLALDFANRVPHEPFFRPLFIRVRAAQDTELLKDTLHAFLDSDRVNERTDDDKTLVIAIRS